MSVISIAVRDKEYERSASIVIGSVKVEEGYIWLQVQVVNYCYKIKKDYITGEWSASAFIENIIGRNYLRNIGLAIDDSFYFSN